MTRQIQMRWIKIKFERYKFTETNQNRGTFFSICKYSDYSILKSTLPSSFLCKTDFSVFRYKARLFYRNLIMFFCYKVRKLGSKVEEKRRIDYWLSLTELEEYFTLRFRKAEHLHCSRCNRGFRRWCSDIWSRPQRWHCCCCCSDRPHLKFYMRLNWYYMCSNFFCPIYWSLLIKIIRLMWILLVWIKEITISCSVKSMKRETMILKESYSTAHETLPS